MFTNFAQEEGSFVKVLWSLRRLTVFCELSIAIVVFRTRKPRVQ